MKYYSYIVILFLLLITNSGCAVRDSRGTNEDIRVASEHNLVIPEWINITLPDDDQGRRIFIDTLHISNTLQGEIINIKDLDSLKADSIQFEYLPLSNEFLDFFGNKIDNNSDRLLFAGLLEMLDSGENRHVVITKGQSDFFESIVAGENNNNKNFRYAFFSSEQSQRLLSDIVGRDVGRCLVRFSIASTSIESLQKKYTGFQDALNSGKDYGAYTTAVKMNVPEFFAQGCLGMAICAIDDGRIMFSGGMIQDRTFRKEISILDTRSLQWLYGGQLVVRKAGHTATLLDGGEKILLAGGGHRCDNFEIYELSSGSNLIGMLEVPRFGHSATKMKDGKVLIAGGFTNGLVPSADRNHSTSTSEIFDPETSGTILGPLMKQKRGYHATILLNDGRVMVSGGLNGVTALSGIEFYDPKSGTFKMYKKVRMKEGRFFHTMTLLPADSDGVERVLIAGGFDQNYKALDSVEICLPPSESCEEWIMVRSMVKEASATVKSRILAANENKEEFYNFDSKHFEKPEEVQMNDGLFSYKVTLLPKQKGLLIADDFYRSSLEPDISHCAFQALASVKIDDSNFEQLTLNEARGGHSAILLGKRWVLFVGGSEVYNGGLSSVEDLNGESLRSVEVFDIKNNIFVEIGSLKVPRGFHQSCVATGDKNYRVFFTPGMGVGASASVEYLDCGSLLEDDGVLTDNIDREAFRSLCKIS